MSWFGWQVLKCTIFALLVYVESASLQCLLGQIVFISFPEQLAIFCIIMVDIVIVVDIVVVIITVAKFAVASSSLPPSLPPPSQMHGEVR